LIGQRSHVALAELMRKHAKPGDLVIFQDLGETPWAAMELRFVDPIGLVDREIARVRWRERNSPFVGLPSERGVAEILDHLFALEPRLVAFVAYTQGYESEVRPLDDAVGSGIRVVVKHENHQPTNAFKVRNALNAVAALDEAVRKLGVIAATRGNHGAGLAWAGARLGAPVVVVVPRGNNPDKNA